MPKVGIEPTLPKEHDFESCASASSATSAVRPRVYVKLTFLSMDEVSLIEQARKGDVDSFNTLILHYQNAVYNAVYRMLGEPDTAADVAQEAFISAYRSLNSFRDGNFKAWLIRIATNACYDEFRRRKRRPLSSLDELTEENEANPILSDNHEAGPEEQGQQAELIAAIEKCLEALPEEQRVTAVLCDVEGYDYNEIATIMSSSLGTVKSRLSRARAKLRDCLQGVKELLPADYRL
jgi:RNA polymerase sigma-70 factor, ECF subfamily